MARYLDPKNDVPFKRVFGEHPNLLISLLNALLPFEDKRTIESIEYLPVETLRETPLHRNSTVDVRCTDNLKRQFIVEMQMYWSSAFTRRMVFNASRAYVRQLEKNEDWHLLQPVYGVAIINDYITPKDEATSFYHHYKTVNLNNTDDIIEGLEFVLVELPKFKPETWEHRKMAVLWLRFLREVNEKATTVDNDLLENENIRMAVDLCEEGAFTAAELEAYDKYWDAIRNEIATNKVSRIEGHAEGLAEGHAEGHAEGLAEGLEKGKEEREKLEQELEQERQERKEREKLEQELEKERQEREKLIVLNCHKSGLPAANIAAITGLSEEEVQTIIMDNFQHETYT